MQNSYIHSSLHSFRFRVLGLLEEEKMHQFNEISIGSLVIINEHA